MKAAIVTGAGAGLGRVLAQGLAGIGMHVLVADIDADAAEETAKMVGGRAVPADIRDPEECHRLVRLAVEAGGPHVLINNAGGWTPGDDQYPDAPADAWSATMTLNLHAPMLLSQLVLDPMRQLGGGAIVNIASSAGAESTGYGSPEYAASKAGLIRLTSSLAGLEQSHGVRMTCIVPGWIGLERAKAQLAALAPEVRAKTPPLIPPAVVVTLALNLIASGRSGTVVEI